MNSVAGAIRGYVIAMSHTEEEAMDVVINWAKDQPGWEHLIETAEDQHTASSLPKAVALALMTLLPALGSAQEVIKQVKPEVRTEVQAPTAKPTMQDLVAIRKAIPNPNFNIAERGMLELGVPFNKFQGAIQDKIDKGLPQVLKAIKGSEQLSKMSPSQLATIISEQFNAKINDAAFADEKDLLERYLKKMDRNMDDVKRLVANHLEMHSDKLRI